MTSVFVILSEQMPVNGTYPATALESVWGNELDAWDELDRIAWQRGHVLHGSDNTFTIEPNPEQYDYIEYRIEEHALGEKSQMKWES